MIFILISFFRQNISAAAVIILSITLEEQDRRDVLIVYGEILFAENLIIGFVLLCITAGIFKINFSDRYVKLRLVAGSILCGIFSLTIFLPVKMPAAIAMEAAFAFTVCAVVLGREKLWKKALTFILVTYFAGGVTMALLLATQNDGLYNISGIYTGDMKAGMLALFIGATFFVSKQIIKTVYNKRFYQEHIFNVIISIGGYEEEAKAFLDTGNGLREPISGRNVAVASDSLWEKFEKIGAVTPERVCLIPYESIGVRGILMAVRTDSIKVEKRVLKKCIIAKGDDNLSIGDGEADGCSLLLSKGMT